MDPRYAGVVATVSMCFDGLYHSEAARLANVLHAQAHYVCATENPHLYMRMDECFRALDQRPSPASRGEARRDEIESVECAGPVTALARVTCAIGPKHFIELLTLIFIDGKSQTISKMFHFDVLYSTFLQARLNPSGAEAVPHPEDGSTATPTSPAARSLLPRPRDQEIYRSG